MSNYPERINISPVHRQKREDDFYLVDRAAFPGKGKEYIRADNAQADKEAAVAAEREAVARWAEGERQTCNNQGDRAGVVAYRRMCMRVRARGDTDALERVRQEAKAEALREAADYHKTEACFQADIGATDYYLMHKLAEKYILALIPDQHKEENDD